MKNDKYNKVIRFILNEIKTGKRDEIPQDISKVYYIFRHNFFKYIGVGELSNLYDYRQQVLEYIEQSYPFCFMENNNLLHFPEVLNKYIRLFGGSEKDIEEICKILKNVTIRNMERQYYNNNYEGFFIDEDVNLESIVGTSIEAYHATNLYDVLSKIDDKRLDNYMWYLCINSVFNNKEKFKTIFSDIGLVADENNNLFVAEGNHRIFSYLALSKIREYFGLKNRSMDFRLEKTSIKCYAIPEETSGFSK